MRRALLLNAVVLAAGVVLRPKGALAQWTVVCPNCSNVATQLMQYAKEAEWLVEQVQTRVNSGVMLQNQIRNMATYPQTLWNQIEGNMNATRSLFDRGSHLSLNASMTASQLGNFRSLSGQVNSLPSLYQQWSVQANENVSTMLSGMGMQRTQRETAEQAVLRAAQAQSQGAGGMMQAIQAGNAIAGTQVNALMQLQTTLEQQSRMAANQAYIQAQQQAVGQAVQQQTIGGVLQPEIGNRSY